MLINMNAIAADLHHTLFIRAVRAVFVCSTGKRDLQVILIYRRRVHYPSYKKDAARMVITDKENEGMVCAKDGHSRPDGCRFHCNSRCGSGLCALLVNIHVGLVDNR